MNQTRNTEIFVNTALYPMRAMVARSLDSLNWRHHGIGCLQGYISEDCEPEIRIHIWSPRLLKPGMDLSGDAHDHRFDMVSHVLAGHVAHQEMIAEKVPDGDHKMLILTNARAAKENNYHGPTTAVDGLFSVKRQDYTIAMGQSYRFRAYTFHRSPMPTDPNHIAVTCIEKYRQQKIMAQLLYPAAVEPVMAFGHDIDKDLCRDIVAQAKAALQ